MRRLPIWLAAMLALATATRAENVLRLGLREDPDLLDPTAREDGDPARRRRPAGTDRSRRSQITQRDGRQLAVGYEYPDATHLVIHLRPNVTFMTASRSTPRR